MTDAEYKKIYDKLNSYQELQYRINGLTNELTKWAAIGTNIAQKYEQGFGGDCDSKTESGGTGLAVVQAQIRDEITQAKKYRYEVVTLLEKASKRRQRTLLTYKFINGLSYEQIATMLGKDISSVRRAIKTAIESMEG